MGCTLFWVKFGDAFASYSCGLSTATIEYSSFCVCLSVCLCTRYSKENCSIDLKLEHIVVYALYLS